MSGFSMPVISPAYARIMVRHLLEKGASEGQIFAGTASTYSKLWDSDDLDLAVFQRLLENGEAIGTEPSVGFLIGQYHNTLALGPTGVAMGCAPTLRHSIQILESYTQVHVSYVKVDAESRLNNMTLRFELEGLTGHALRHHVEASFCLMQRFVELLTGEFLTDAKYCVSFDKPSNIAEYSQFLRSPVSFNQREISLQLPKRVLDCPSPYYHSEMWRQSQIQLSTRLRELGYSDRGVFRRYVVSRLRSYEPPLPKLAQISDDLHTSERTLNRRLKEEGASFRELRNSVLNQWAQLYLKQSDASIESIAASLGYQDAANFRRAFRGMNQMTPG
ncbi:MAG: AraC family transcriptional regulator ligand-binding domain-containing protein, partial [Pseudomonadales bacterium]